MANDILDDDGKLWARAITVTRADRPERVHAPIHGPVEYGDTIAGRIARYPALRALVAPFKGGHWHETTLDWLVAQEAGRAFDAARAARGVNLGLAGCLCTNKHGQPILRRIGILCDVCGYNGYNAIRARLAMPNCIEEAAERDRVRANGHIPSDHRSK